MSHKQDAPPAYYGQPNAPQPTYAYPPQQQQGGGAYYPPQQGGGGYYQQQPPMGYQGGAPGPYPPPQQQQQGGYYAPGPAPTGYYQQGPQMQDSRAGSSGNMEQERFIDMFGGAAVHRNRLLPSSRRTRDAPDWFSSTEPVRWQVFGIGKMVNREEDW
ncbi:hypothetical protein VPNG_04171 [Cytospora leucostoma]|uniref:Uncharacterized protein n=1 Tax=Cytospora leucostoma TaxID=1230097 RepID=A0A423XDE5_9PEZI|nr:hypothetical protein VPNG_04171 [Cytospora leucostoma]